MVNEGWLRVRHNEQCLDESVKSTYGNEMKSPIVSIITVVYNGEKYIEQTIKSVLGQTYQNIEYIIIDGGSTDSTVEIIKRYDHAIDYWVSEPDSGISDAFNKGILASSGTIVGIINADDWYERDSIAAVVDSVERVDWELVHGNLRYWNAGRVSQVVVGNHTLLKRNMTINHPTVFVKRELYDRIGLFRTDFRIAMDYEWLLRAETSGVRFHYMDCILANMRHGGVSEDAWQKTIKETAKAKRLHTSGPLNSAVFQWFQMSKAYLRRGMERIGLGCLVNYYQAHVSAVKKIKMRD